MRRRWDMMDKGIGPVGGTGRLIKWKSYIVPTLHLLIMIIVTNPGGLRMIRMAGMGGVYVRCCEFSLIFFSLYC